MVTAREVAFALLAVAVFLCIAYFAAEAMAKKNSSVGFVLIIGFSISAGFWAVMLLVCDMLEKGGWVRDA